MFPANRNQRRRRRITTISAEVFEARRVLSAMTGGVSIAASPETLIEPRTAREQDHARDLTAQRSEQEAKDTFEPTKPHMNVGTIGHIRESSDSTGRQGGHMTVLEDYEQDNDSAFMTATSPTLPAQDDCDSPNPPSPCDPDPPTGEPPWQPPQDVVFFGNTYNRRPE